MDDVKEMGASVMKIKKRGRQDPREGTDTWSKPGSSSSPKREREDLPA